MAAGLIMIFVQVFMCFCELLAFWKVCSFTVYVTQYLVGAPFALLTASIRRGMEVISLLHC